jgi:hypothetical protein
MNKIKEFFKGLLLKVLAGLKKVWDKVRPKAWNFLKKWGLHILNLLVLLLAYAKLDTLTSLGIYCLVGFWIFFLLAYYIFWELCRAKNLFKKDEEG